MVYALLSGARSEYLDAIEFYEQRKPGLGFEFIQAVEAAISKILEAPPRWPVLEANIRRCLVDTFPYAILYKIEPDRVLIIAVMHCSRKPGYWKYRLN